MLLLEEMNELGKHVDGYRVGCFSFHVSDQLGSSELPLYIGLLLKALIGVAHHSDQQVNQDYDDKHVVKSKHSLCHALDFGFMIF